MGLSEDVQNCSAESLVIMRDVSSLLVTVQKCIDKKNVSQVLLLLPRISYMKKRLSEHHKRIVRLMENVRTTYQPEQDRHIVLSGLDNQLVMTDKDLSAIDELKESVNKLRSSV